ncbi:hypothetical protein BZA77DRAFT_302286 [Pyronema omphalodes]|nr:hypothetical protein BZA77DRAFT_302286 [Pyronema omphalodes]
MLGTSLAVLLACIVSFLSLSINYTVLHLHSASLYFLRCRLTKNNKTCIRTVIIRRCPGLLFFHHSSPLSASLWTLNSNAQR